MALKPRQPAPALDLEGGVARVCMNKPDKMNAMTLKTVDEMFRAFYDASHDPMIGVIFVSGAGKHFGAGGDVEWEKWGLRAAFYNRYPHNRLVRMSRKPIIAAVQGYCLGGHNHMAYCCDFTIAADTAIFGQAGPRVASPADGFFVPYLTKVEPITSIAMARVIAELYTDIAVPFGVNVLWDGVASIELAAATLILIGNPGTGKTFLAKCIAYAACNANIKVLFTSAIDMINHLIAAEADRSLLRKLHYYQSPALLVCDELGYLSLGPQGSHLFFQVISARHQAKSTLITTNLPFADWGKVFDSTTVATAIADRLVHNSEVLILGGTSYRRKQK